MYYSVFINSKKKLMYSQCIYSQNEKRVIVEAEFVPLCPKVAVASII